MENLQQEILSLIGQKRALEEELSIATAEANEAEAIAEKAHGQWMNIDEDLTTGIRAKEALGQKVTEIEVACLDPATGEISETNDALYDYTNTKEKYTQIIGYVAWCYEQRNKAYNVKNATSEQSKDLKKKRDGLKWEYDKVENDLIEAYRAKNNQLQETIKDFNPDKVADIIDEYRQSV